VEKQILFRDNQELQADDFVNQQAWAQQAIDHVVNDTINGGKAYWGFNLTKAAATTVKTSPGRLYNAGMVYAREDEVSIDLYNQLPVTAKKYFAIVAWGQSVDEDIQPRNFLVDADTGMAEPQSVAMQRTRYCNVSTLAGQESADPQQPAADATYTVIGYALCDPSGIISVQQSTLTQIDNLALIGAGMRAMMAWRGIVDASLATLRTDLANLARQLLLYTPLSEFQKLVDIVNELWQLVHRTAPATLSYYGTDRFLDTSQSDTLANVDGVYSAQINEGLRFPGNGAGWQGKLQLFNPSEPVVTSYGGFILPRPSGSRVRYDCSFPSLPFVPVRILSFGYWTFNCKQLSPARWRYRAGPHFAPSPPSQVWWHQSQYDPTRILAFDTESATWLSVDWGDTVLHTDPSVQYPRVGWDRWNRYWRDWVDVDYWTKVYTDFSHSGNHCAQTFYNAQDGWMTGLTLFSHKALYQPITLVISGCADNAAPDQSTQTLRRVVLDAATTQSCYEQPMVGGDIVSSVMSGTDPLNPLSSPFFQQSTGISVDQIITVENLMPGGGPNQGMFRVYYRVPAYIYPLRINFPPVFCRAGQHIALHVHSTFDHEFSFCDRDDCYQVHQGNFWRHNGTEFARWTDGPRTLRFMAHFATWGRWGDQQSPGGQLSYQINLQSLQLAGGIGAVDVLAEAIVPAATDLNFAINSGSGGWKKFEQDFSALSGSDNLLQFRVEMTGTTDLMPGISLTNSQVTLSKAAALAFHHISKPITTGGPVSSVKISARLNNYVEVHHNCNISLHYGATNNTSPVTTEMLSDDTTTIMRTSVFTTTSITSFVIKIDGATDGVGDNFFVSERIAYA
jgi:hypothetical protein